MLIYVFDYSTCFLMGPVNQIKKMFAPTRIVATVIVAVSFAITLFAAIGVIAFIYKHQYIIIILIQFSTKN